MVSNKAWGTIVLSYMFCMNMYFPSIVLSLQQSSSNRSSSNRSSNNNVSNNDSSSSNGKTRRDVLKRTSERVSLLVSLSVGLSSSTCKILRPQFVVQPANALSPEEAATAYDSYAKKYDDLDGGKAADLFGLDVARSDLFGQARGHVLEIGVGTGLNLLKYDPSKLESLTLVDVSEGMLHETEKRIQTIPFFSLQQHQQQQQQQQVPITFVQADATSELVDKFGKGSFDTVVDSFSLCVMGTKGAADCLQQMQHVVKTKQNNGQILLLENARSSNPILGSYQDTTAEFAASAGGKGCVYNQDVKSIIQSTRGIEIIKENLYISGIFRSYQCQTIL